MDIDSILNLYSKTYLNLPRPIRSFLGSVYGSIPLRIRFGNQYILHKKILEKYENSSKQFQLDYLYNKTFETLQFAYDNIPHYTNKFNQNNFKPKDFKCLDDIKKVPLLTKQMIQNDLKNLFTNKIDKPVAVQTGGSTFTPTRFYVSLNTTRAKERAYNNYIFSKIGYKYRDRTLVLRAKVTPEENRGIYWSYEMVANQLWLSANHINSRCIEKMISEVRIFKPKFIWGYPSAVSFFVNECLNIGLNKMENISGVFLTSEIILPEQREKISNFFQCDVLSHYGHRESTSIGYRINQSSYHFLNSYGATRIVDNELITSSFDNFVMPFINYKTQDYVNGKFDFIDKSDFAVNIGNIEGRLQDFIVTKDGTLRTVLGISMGHSPYMAFVKAAQYYQETPGKIIIRIESENPKKVKVRELVDSLEKFVENSFDFEIEFVDNIKKTPLGKWKTCVQKLDIEKFK